MECYTPPPIRLAAHFVASGTLLAALIVSLNFVMIRTSLHIVA